MPTNNRNSIRSKVAHAIFRVYWEEQNFNGVFVEIDFRDSGVILPAGVAKQYAQAKTLILQLGQKLARPTPVLFEEDGVEFVASFGGTNHECYFPWGALMSIAQDSGAGFVMTIPHPNEPEPERAQAPQDLPEVIKLSDYRKLRH